MAKPKAEPKIVEAVGTSAGAARIGGRELSKRIEAAMAQAVTDALAEGISINDTETIKARTLEARAAVLAEVNAQPTVTED
jgi:hypothetical protein